MPSRVVFDIETLALPFDSFDEAQQAYLLHGAHTATEREEMLQKLNLYPLTAQVIAIAMLNPDTNKGNVLYQTPEPEQWVSDDEMIEFIGGNEHQILEQFWKTIEKYEQIISFNGRTFDGPFLMIRSAVLGVKPSRNLVPYRYSPKDHCDLLDQLTFYGAFRRFSLDFYCKAFGIKSPKSEGITGLSLGELYRNGEYRRIAQYCLGDTIATAELFRRWDLYLNFSEE